MFSCAAESPTRSPHSDWRSAIQGCIPGVSCNDCYVPQNSCGLEDSCQSQLRLLEEERPARTEPPDLRSCLCPNLFSSPIEEPFRSCVCAHITQSSVAPPNHPREANPGYDTLANQKIALGVSFSDLLCGSKHAGWWTAGRVSFAY